MLLKKLSKILHVIIGVIFLIASFWFIPEKPQRAYAATCTASAGNWSNSAIWSCGRVPLATDDVVIPNTNGVNVTVDTAAVALTVAFTAGNQANAITISGTNSLTVTNAITIGLPSANKIKNIAVGSGSLSAGSVSLLGTTGGTNLTQITISTGTVNVTGDITSAGVASQIIFSGAGRVNIGGRFMTGTIGTFTPSTGTVNFNNNGAQFVSAYTFNNVIFSGSGSPNIKTTNGGSTTLVNGILSIEGTATYAVGSDSLTYGAAATLQYKGSIAQTTGVEFTTPWAATGGVKVENANGVTLTAIKTINATSSLTIGGTMANSIFNDGGFQLTSTGTLNLTSGTFKLGSATTATTFPAFGTRNISAGTTVEYAAGVAQTVSATPSYQNLTFSGAGTKTIAAGGTASVAVNWAVGSATTITTTANATVTGNISGSGAITMGSGTITLAGNWTNNGAFTKGTGTVIYNGGSAQTVAALSYNNLTLSGAGTKTAAASTVAVGATLTNSSTFGMAGFTLTAVSTANAGGTIRFSGATNGLAVSTGTIEYYGTTQTVTTGTYNNLTINQSSGTTATLGGNVTVNTTLTFTAGKINTGANTLTIAATGSISGASSSSYVVGNLQKSFNTGAGQSFNFAVGDATNYTPVAIANATVGTAGSLTVTTTAGQHPNIGTSTINSAKDVARYWTLTAGGGLAMSTYDPTFNFVTGDVIGGANFNNFIIGRYSSGWTYPTVGTKTSTSTQATGLPAFGDFAIGESLPTLTLTIVDSYDRSGTPHTTAPYDSAFGNVDPINSPFYIGPSGSAPYAMKLNAQSSTTWSLAVKGPANFSSGGNNISIGNMSWQNKAVGTWYQMTTSDSVPAVASGSNNLPLGTDISVCYKLIINWTDAVADSFSGSMTYTLSAP